jgi:hypothetical protein
MCWLLFCQTDQNYSKKDRIEMKSINTDAWLVNFILSFSGLSPILIGKKSIFFKLTWHRRPQQCAHLLDSTQPKQARPNKISSKKATIGPNKNFGLYPATNGPNSFYDAYDLSQLACHIRFCLAWHSCRTKLMMHCIDGFPHVIQLMTPRNQVSSLITVCDARSMMEHFVTTSVINRGLWRETNFFASLVSTFRVANRSA